MRRVLIYGGTGGIGRATARALRGRGYALHLAARDAGRLQAAASELGETTTSAGEAADPDFFARATTAAGGALAGLVYAVGTINLRPLGRLTRADAEADFRINALGAFSAVQAASTRSGRAGARPARGSYCSRPSRRGRASRPMPAWRWPRARWRA